MPDIVKCSLFSLLLLRTQVRQTATERVVPRKVRIERRKNIQDGSRSTSVQLMDELYRILVGGLLEVGHLLLLAIAD